MRPMQAHYHVGSGDVQLACDLWRRAGRSEGIRQIGAILHAKRSVSGER